MSMVPLILTSIERILELILFVLEVMMEAVGSLYKKLFTSFSSTSSALSAVTQQRKRKTVVIVGGNFSGLAALEELSYEHDSMRIILIDQKDYFEYTPGVLRLFCNPSLFPQLARPLPTGSTHEVIQGRVVSIQSNNKTLFYEANRETSTDSANRTRLDFDYLILATGSSYKTDHVTAAPSSWNLADRQEEWIKAQDQLKQAKSVLILGGGAVGVELAAEIVDHYANSKKVTIADGSASLVPLFPKATGDYARKWLEKMSVDLRLGEIFKSWDGTSCTFQDGTILRADIVIQCFGDMPNSQVIAGLLDKRKCVTVKKTLLLESSLNGENSTVFCCGDVAAPPTAGNKQAFHAEIQGKVAARNAIRMAKQLPLLRYPDDIAGSSEMPLVYVLSLGRYDGVLGFNELTLCGPVAALFKWILEYTKVMHMQGRPLGKLIWKVGDAAVIFLSRTIIKPKRSSSKATIIAKTSN